MKVKDIQLKLNIKNYKAGKFLHLFALDVLESLERSHPRIVPLLLASLKHGDPKKSLKKAEELEKLFEGLHKRSKHLRECIEDYMYSHLENDEEGKGSSFITPNGNLGFSYEKGKETIEMDFDSSGGDKTENEDTEEDSKEE